ncbi:MAG: hypothetical protein WA118_01540 [Carboxydocellales bacterium]
MKNMLGKIDKKDLIYWLIILGATIIVTLTVKVADNATTVNYFGFAGTITSIILAAIAIVYSIFQSLSSGSSTEKLIESASKIQEVTIKIDNSTNDLTLVSKSITDLNQKLTSIVDIPDKIKDMNVTIQTLEKTIMSSYQIDKSEVAKLQPSEEKHKIINDIISRNLLDIRSTAYFFIKAHELGIGINFKAIAEFRNAQTDIAKNVDFGVIFAQLAELDTFNLVKPTKEGKELHIKFVDNDFKEKILSIGENSDIFKDVDEYIKKITDL